MADSNSKRREYMKGEVAEFLRNHKDGLGTPLFHGDTEQAYQAAEIILNILAVDAFDIRLNGQRTYHE